MFFIDAHLPEASSAINAKNIKIDEQSGGNINWYSHCGNTVWRYLIKLIIELSYDPAVPLLGIYPNKTMIEKDT